jgi:hypothetical protein
MNSGRRCRKQRDNSLVHKRVEASDNTIAKGRTEGRKTKSTNQNQRKRALGRSHSECVRVWSWSKNRLTPSLMRVPASEEEIWVKSLRSRHNSRDVKLRMKQTNIGEAERRETQRNKKTKACQVKRQTMMRKASRNQSPLMGNQRASSRWHHRQDLDGLHWLECWHEERSLISRSVR